jgi:hypothetical protein
LRVHELAIQVPEPTSDQSEYADAGDHQQRMVRVVLWRRLVRRGIPPSDAVAAALALAVVFLALDLTLLVGADSGGIFWLAQVGLVVTILVWNRSKRKPA